MEHRPEPETTALLRAWGGGDEEAGRQLVERLYPELHRLAASRLDGAGAELTLQTTELAHEAYLRLVAQRRVEWVDRSHFFAVAARLIRRVLLNHIRDRGRLKRGGDLQRVTLEVDRLAGAAEKVDFVALDGALDLLARVDAEAASVVELRYIVGLTVPEVARVLGVSESTVARQWRSARLWLRARLREEGSGSRSEG